MMCMVGSSALFLTRGRQIRRFKILFDGLFKHIFTGQILYVLVTPANDVNCGNNSNYLQYEPDNKRMSLACKLLRFKLDISRWNVFIILFVDKSKNFKKFQKNFLKICTMGREFKSQKKGSGAYLVQDFGVKIIERPRMTHNMSHKFPRFEFTPHILNSS